MNLNLLALLLMLPFSLIFLYAVGIVIKNDGRLFLEIIGIFIIIIVINGSFIFGLSILLELLGGGK